MYEDPPLIDRMQKLGEIYADPETGLSWIVYDPPLAGIVMEGFMDSDIEVQEALEFDEEGNLRLHTYDHPEGMVYRNGEWRSLSE
jgi:hypothetical protein